MTAGHNALRGAARQCAYRRRKRNGLITVSIEIEHFEIAELLVHEGLLWRHASTKIAS
jgi:hypothetical protein